MSLQQDTPSVNYSVEPAYDCYFWFRKENNSREEIIRVKNSAKDSIMEWVLSVQTDLQIAEIVSSVSSELIENTYKYALIPSECSVWIRYCGDTATIQSRNDSQPDQKKKLKHFTEIINSSDLEKLSDYREGLIYPDESMQLGLLRINDNGFAKIEYHEGEDEESVHLQLNLTF